MRKENPTRRQQDRREYRETGEEERFWIPITALPITYCLFAPLHTRNSTCLLLPVPPFHPLASLTFYTSLYQCTFFRLILLLPSYTRAISPYPLIHSHLSSAIRSAIRSFLASALFTHPLHLLIAPPFTSPHSLQKRCQLASKSETLVGSESTHTYFTRPSVPLRVIGRYSNPIELDSLPKVVAACKSLILHPPWVFETCP